MKKLTIFLAALALCFSVSAKTWTNYTGFGWRIPTSTTVKSDDSSMDFDIKFKNQTGLSLDYTGAHESGFSMRAILDINYSNSNLKAGDDDDDLEGLNGLFLIGAGYAPVCTDKLFLGIYGVLGADLTVLYLDKTAYTNYQKSENEYSLTHAASVLGANVTFVYTPAKHFSLFASICTNYMFPTKVEADMTQKVNGVKIFDSDEKYDYKGAFKFVPTAGICWKF